MATGDACGFESCMHDARATVQTRRKMMLSSEKELQSEENPLILNRTPSMHSARTDLP